MRQAHYKQKEYLAEFLNKQALMASAALIFGQFVPNRFIDLPVLIGGTIFVIIVTSIAYNLKRPPTTY